MPINSVHPVRYNWQSPCGCWPILQLSVVTLALTTACRHVWTLLWNGVWPSWFPYKCNDLNKTFDLYSFCICVGIVASYFDTFNVTKQHNLWMFNDDDLQRPRPLCHTPEGSFPAPPTSGPQGTAALDVKIAPLFYSRHLYPYTIDDLLFLSSDL